MANCSRGRGRMVRAVTAATAAPTTPEPAVRRWPHPVEGQAAARPDASELYYIRCALSYENQLLSEIKTLLQQLCETQKEG